MNVLTIYIHRQCGVKDPSWGEIKHFVCFLDTQLRSCEKSVFCDENIVGDVMTGLKTFAVKFMIRMSKVRTSFIIKWRRSCLLYNPLLSNNFSYCLVAVYYWHSIHSFISHSFISHCRILLHLH